MEFKTSMDKAGRVLLPRCVLRQVQFAPGDELRVESDGDTITLRHVHAKSMLTKEMGIWVYKGGFSARTISHRIDSERQKRLCELL